MCLKGRRQGRFGGFPPGAASGYSGNVTAGLAPGEFDDVIDEHPDNGDLDENHMQIVEQVLPPPAARKRGECSLPPASSRTMMRMPYFLFKTEPDAYSFDDFLRDKETVWDGVTNPTAVKNLREMPKGTKWIFYHTGDERRAVGTGTVTSVDASDPKTPVVRVKAGKRLNKPKTLEEIKAEPLFKDSPLVKIGRLSVVPLTEDQWNWFQS